MLLLCTSKQRQKNGNTNLWKKPKYKLSINDKRGFQFSTSTNTERLLFYNSCFKIIHNPRYWFAIKITSFNLQMGRTSNKKQLPLKKSSRINCHYFPIFICQLHSWDFSRKHTRCQITNAFLIFYCKESSPAPSCLDVDSLEIWARFL